MMELFDRLTPQAAALLADCREKELRLATAESCTGGLISALLTEVPGSSDVFDRGFVTYSNEAKTELLGVDQQILEAKGAVSAEIAEEMARRAIDKSDADIALSVTGIAGPGGGSPQKPVGLVYLAVCKKDSSVLVDRNLFGDIGRSEVRLAALRKGLAMLEDAVPN